MKISEENNPKWLKEHQYWMKNNQIILRFLYNSNRTI